MARKQPIIAYRDGEEVARFQSMQEACEWLGGYKMPNLSSHLHRHRPRTIRGYTFKMIRQRKPKRFDWNPYVKLLLWHCHRACRCIKPEYKEEAWEYVLEYVCRHLSQYRGKTTPNTHLRRSADWGVLQWMKRHYRQPKLVQVDEAEWRTISERPAMSSLDRLLDEMPDQWRRLAEARLEGCTMEEAMVQAGLDRVSLGVVLAGIRNMLEERLGFAHRRTLSTKTGENV